MSLRTLKGIAIIRQALKPLVEENATLQADIATARGALGEIIDMKTPSKPTPQEAFVLFLDITSIAAKGLRERGRR